MWQQKHYTDNHRLGNEYSRGMQTQIGMETTARKVVHLQARLDNPLSNAQEYWSVILQIKKHTHTHTKYDKWEVQMSLSYFVANTGSMSTLMLVVIPSSLPWVTSQHIMSRASAGHATMITEYVGVRCSEVKYQAEFICAPTACHSFRLNRLIEKRKNETFTIHTPLCAIYSKATVLPVIN